MTGFKTLEIIRLGFGAIRRHPMRSLLTMLGILCGVTAVIAMLAIGEGTSLETQEQFLRLGATNILLTSVKPADIDQGGGGGQVVEYGLTYDDAERIQTTLPNVEVVVPQRRIPRTVRYLHRKTRADIVGTVPWAGGLTNARVARGRFLNEIDERRGFNLCVLGSGIAEDLFKLEDPLGKAIAVQEGSYRVIGIMAERGRAAKSDSNTQQTDYNREVYIPLSTARNRFGETIWDFESGSRSAETVELHEIVVRCDEVDQVLTTSRAVRELLDRYHDRDDFVMNVPYKQIQVAQETGERFKRMLAAIAAISLVVGGIGIMNIMLASVTERTPEIGVRRALGAKKRDIVMQFLVETLTISFVGGLFGVVLGYVIPTLIERFADQRTEVTASSLILSVGISLAVGLVFGLYPAWRAAQLDPIQALRHE